MWSREKGTTPQAPYLPGEENARTDWESRVMRDCSDWMLNPAIFQKVLRQFPDLEIDLFAFRLSFQLPRFFQLETGPLSGNNKCVPPRMEWGESVCKPPMEPARESHAKGGAANSRSDTHTCSSSVAFAAMVPQAAQLLTAVPLRIRQRGGDE